MRKTSSFAQITRVLKTKLSSRGYRRTASDVMMHCKRQRMMIGQPRKKFEPDKAASRYIITGPWIGYRFNPGDE